MKNNEKGNKNYKVPFIICFTLIIINLIATGLIAYGLFMVIIDIDDDLQFTKEYIVRHNLKEEESTWDEVQRFMNFNIKKPDDWIFEGATTTYCVDYTFCQSLYADVTFTIGKSTTYNEFLEYLKNEVDKTSGGNYDFSKIDDKDKLSFYKVIGNDSHEREIILFLKQDNNKAYLNYTYDLLYPEKIVNYNLIK